MKSSHIFILVGIAVAIGATFGDHRLGAAVAIEVAVMLDFARFVRRRAGVAAALPEAVALRETGGAKDFGAFGRRRRPCGDCGGDH